MDETTKGNIEDRLVKIDFDPIIDGIIRQAFKSGFKSSEFWFLAVANVINICLVGAGINLGVETVIIINAVGLIYGFIRSIVKKDGTTETREVISMILKSFNK